MNKKINELEAITQTIMEPLTELKTDIAVVKTTVYRLEKHLERLNGQVQENTSFRLKHGGEVRIIYWVVAAMCIPIVLIVVDNIARRL